MKGYNEVDGPCPACDGTGVTDETNEIGEPRDCGKCHGGGDIYSAVMAVARHFAESPSPMSPLWAAAVEIVYPAGLVAIPLEPTDEMLDAVHPLSDDYEEDELSTLRACRAMLADHYRAMVAAAMDQT